MLKSKAVIFDKKANLKERMWFVEYWANYVKSHSDKEWSRQQNILIDSQIKGARLKPIRLL